MNKKIPNFFIVGAPKCGTTSLYKYLNQHPDVFMPEIKEPHFFGSDIKFLHKMSYRNLENYMALFEKADKEKRLGEASIWYLYSKNAAKEIFNFNPSSKIIIMLRNPVDMMFSLHGHLFYLGVEEIADFEKALNYESIRKEKGGQSSKAGMTKATLYREIASFHDQVRRYIDTFGTENVHFIVFEEFIKDARAYIRKTAEFLEIDRDFEAATPVVNPRKKIRNKTVHKFTVNYSSYIDGFLNGSRSLGMNYFKPTKLSNSIMKAVKKLNTTAGASESMDLNVRKYLISEFRPEIRKLEKLIEKDLSFWLEA